MTPATVHQLSVGITEADYRAERQRIRATYGDSKREAGAHADQALAALFLRSGWTQERLAEVEKKSQDWISLRVRFGAFLSFTTTVVNPEWPAIQVKLTEGMFRSYWKQTSDLGDYPKPRFAAVQKALLADLHISKSTANKLAVGRAIVELADGVWHRQSTIVTHAQKVCAALNPPVVVTDEDVHAVLYLMVDRGTYGVRCEKRKGATGWSYRLVRAGRTVKADVFLAEIRPILDGLKAEGRKNMATMSPWTVAQLADRLEKLLDSLVKGEREPASSGSAPEDEDYG